MAHRRSRQSYPAARITTTPIATHRVLRQTPLNLLAHQLQEAYRAQQAPLNDLRRYNPYRLPAPQTLAGRRARLNNQKLRTLYQTPWQILEPSKVSICIRRKQRREVLHALRRTGKGSRSKRRYNATTNYSCK